MQELARSKGVLLRTDMHPYYVQTPASDRRRKRQRSPLHGFSSALHNFSNVLLGFSNALHGLRNALLIA